MKRDTRLIHSGRPQGGDGYVNAPVGRASTVLAPSTDELYGPTPPRRHYGRGGVSPNGELRAALCELYEADHCALASSGLAAVVLAIRAAIEAPGEALITDSVYGPVRRFCDEELPRLGVTVRYYDPRIGSGITALTNEQTRLILLESPGSLTFEVQDIAAITSAAKAVGAKTVIDDTWSAGLLMNPLDHGVDYAAQALTKYVGGHSDFLAGAVLARRQDAALLKDRETLYGQHVSPDDAFLALRGFRTLSLRLEKSGSNSLILAKRLSELESVAEVLHPGFEGSRDYSLYKRYFSAPAGCFSIVLKGLSARDGEAIAERMKLFGMGFSWGGFESLVLPCDRQIRRTAVPWRAEGALLRLAIGLEDVDDLWDDIEQAFA
jgi:cystathionine beta-lyase